MLNQISKDLIKTESKQNKIKFILNRRLEDFFGENDKFYKQAFKILNGLYQSMNKNQINIEFGFFLDDDIQKEMYSNKEVTKWKNIK
mgnify:FL=1